MSYHTTPDNWPLAAKLQLFEQHGPAREPHLVVGPTPRRDYPPAPLSRPKPLLLQGFNSPPNTAACVRGRLAKAAFCSDIGPQVAYILAADAPLRIRDLPQAVRGTLDAPQLRYRLNLAVQRGTLQVRVVGGRHKAFFSAAKDWPEVGA